MTSGLHLKDYRLTTAEILYHMPDHPGLLQTYLWQDMDLAPDYPALHRFIGFWHRQIEGKLHSIRVANAGLLQPGRLAHANHLLTLH